MTVPRSAAPLLLLAAVAMVTAAAPPSPPPTPTEIVVCDTAGSRSNALIVGDGHGGAFVAWTDMRAAGLDVYAQRLLSGGQVDPTWRPCGSAVCTALYDQSVETLIGDGQGGAFVAWLDGRGGVDNDVYVERLGANGRPWPGQAAQGVALCTATGHQNGVDLVSDGKGGAIAAWFDYRAGVEAHIYAQHVTAAGAVDARWPSNGLPVCTAPEAQYFPKLVEDGAGGAIVTWYDRRNGSDYDIYARHILATGSGDARWPSQGRALCTAEDDQRNPVIVTDRHGGAVVAWMDRRRERDADIYAQHVLASGAVDSKWPRDGLGVCTAPGAQDPPALVTDGAGGAIAVWIDERSGVGVYAQHALATGSLDPAWPPDALPVCTANQDKAFPGIVTDGSGGAFVAWQDHRSGADYDLYAQHVLAGGIADTTWAADGRLVAAGRGDQAKPAIARLGANGFALAWEDTRRTPDVEIRALLAPGRAPATSGTRRNASRQSAR